MNQPGRRKIDARALEEYNKRQKALQDKVRSLKVAQATARIASASKKEN